MKKLKRLVLTLIQKLKRKPKTWQLSDTENNFKFSKGDWVIISDVDQNNVLWRNDGVRVLNMRKKALPMTAKVIKYELGIKEPIYIVELYGGLLRFPESVLKYQNSDDERDWKIKQLLRVST